MAAAALGVSTQTLKRWRDSGRLQPGTHYKRRYVGNVNSPMLYDVPRIEMKLGKLEDQDAKDMERKLRHM